MSSKVMLVQHKKTKNYFALKQIDSEFSESVKKDVAEIEVDMFLNIEHPFIVRMHGYF
jgi:hypothetical protein